MAGFPLEPSSPAFSGPTSPDREFDWGGTVNMLCPAVDLPEEAAAGVLIRSACITQLPFATSPERSICGCEVLFPLACLL
jgi:hypothetical protein